ncbi:TetR/AcrR family transcriptional regulator [Permianibacter aggregans]
MSKSGVFAHFGSKEELQLAVLKQAADDFIAHVLQPAITSSRGTARIQKVFELWLRYSALDEQAGGCLFIAAAAEFDDRPGAIRDYVSEQQRQWRQSLMQLVQSAIKHGDLPTDTDVEQLAFELFSLVLACHHDRRLMAESSAASQAQRGLERLLRHPPLKSS